MIKILFKNVGQGDSILIEWIKDSKQHYGIIDCNIFESRNPLLEEIISRDIKYIDFVIVSHLHFDHYSGFVELLEYCILNDIHIGQFLHTFSIEYFKILSKILITQFELKTTERFLNAFRSAYHANLFDDIDDVTHNFSPIYLSNSIYLSFLAPTGSDYFRFSHNQAKYINGSTSAKPDFNTLSTIIQIENLNEVILLTSDATIKAFKRIIGKITKKVELIQVPHHGSTYNLLPSFWDELTTKKDCPSLFSVGDVQKDKLPNKEVVEYFDLKGYYNESTNFVHGLVDFYNPTVGVNSISLTLSLFSTLKSSTKPSTIPISRFQGDKFYSVLN